MKTKQIRIAGIVLTVLAGLWAFVGLFGLGWVEWCQVTDGVRNKNGWTVIEVQSEKFSRVDVRLFPDDTSVYRPGEIVLVQFPMGPPYVLRKRGIVSAIKYYLFGWPAMLLAGIGLLAFSFVRSRKPDASRQVEEINGRTKR
jgi:hypothetical protein